MTNMIILIVLFIIIMIVVLSLSIIGYKHLLLRGINTFKNKISNKSKKIILVISILLGLITINFLSMYGLFLLHFLIFTYILEFIYFLIKSITKKEFEKVKIIKNICIIPLIFTCIYFYFGYLNMQNIVETKYTIETKKDISKNYKVILISDVHYGSYVNKNNLKKSIKKIVNLKPDIVILGGDIVDENTSNKEMKEVFNLLGDINPSIGTYFVYGNHDKQNYSRHKKYTINELENELKTNNIEIICDDVKIINDDIIIYGREDASFERKELSQYINKKENKQKFSITIDHQPRDYKSSKDNNIDLILSGHTHAGQIFPSKYIIDIFNIAELSYGYKKDKNLNAIVSSGISGWGFPIRTQKHSEYVLIDIVKK